jgi:hypothetical protein
MIDPEALDIAARCRHYAMCKIDYLGTGLCPAAVARPYASFYPQGRMDIYKALAASSIPVTEELIEIAGACSLCGSCDKQCYFVTELRPLRVMTALKDFVEDHLKHGLKVTKVEPDEVVTELRAIVGAPYATNDPAHLAAYAGDLCPIAESGMPRYVALPAGRDEVAAIVRLCGARNLPFVVRGNGASSMGFALGPGRLILDTNRMRGITIDRERWCAAVEAGVSSFDLQREAQRHGLRANVAEPAALVCANLMCSGIFSLLGAAYGTCASNCVNAEFVDMDGNIFDLNRAEARNLFAFKKDIVPMPAVCTKAWVKLHPIRDDEEGVFVPFSDFGPALAFAEDVNRRNMGFGIGILGAEYISAFMAPTMGLAARLKEIFPLDLGIHFLVLVLGDKPTIEAVTKMAGGVVIDQRLFRSLLLGAANLAGPDLLSLLREAPADRPLYELLCHRETQALIDTALDPSPETMARAVPDDLRDFFADLYERPEMSDPVWLNMFRIVSARMGREKPFVACIVYVPLDKKDLIREMLERFKAVADGHGVANGYGFVMPMDSGKRALLEYDYYFDHTDAADVDRIRRALNEVAGYIMETSARVPGVVWIRHLVFQGFSRMENVFYI